MDVVSLQFLSRALCLERLKRHAARLRAPIHIRVKTMHWPMFWTMARLDVGAQHDIRECERTDVHACASVWARVRACGARLDVLGAEAGHGLAASEEGLHCFKRT